MIEDIFSKIKNVFGGKKPQDKPVEKFSYETLQQNFTPEVKSYFGSSKQEFLDTLRKTCRTRKIWENKSIILISSEGPYSIQQASFLFKNKPQTVEISSLDDYISSSQSTIFNVNSANDSWKSTLKSGIETVQFVTSSSEILQEADYYIFGNVSRNLPEMLDLYLKHKSKVIGWSANKSHYERGKSIPKELASLPLNTYRAVEMDENTFLAKLKSGAIDFNDMLFILNKVQELMTNPLIAKFGFKLNDSQKKMLDYQKSIILSMNSAERKKYSLLIENPSRVSRIAKGSGVSEEQVRNLINLITHLKAKSADIAKMASDPTKLSELMKSFSGGI